MLRVDPQAETVQTIIAPSYEAMVLEKRSSYRGGQYGFYHYKVKKDGQWGLLRVAAEDARYQIILEPEYDSVYSRDDQLGKLEYYFVQQNGKKGLITTVDAERDTLPYRQVAPPLYDSLDIPPNGIVY